MRVTKSVIVVETVRLILMPAVEFHPVCAAAGTAAVLLPIMTASRWLI